MKITNKIKDRWIQELFDYLKIPSISTDSKCQNSIKAAAIYLQALLKNAGCKKTELLSGYGNTLVYAEYLTAPEKPTILIYGHYDVQPPGDLKLWNREPFSPYIKSTNIHPEGAIFARGVSDQKGQLFIYIKALEYLIKTESLECNVKFLIEGEEEIGSINLHQFVKDYKVLLASDIILISDTAFVDKETPTITTSLRGFTGVEVQLKTTKDEKHSGHFGGALLNPVFELCRLINGLKDENERITIEGFYDSVISYSEPTRKKINLYPLSMNVEDTQFLSGEINYSPIEHASIRPSLDIHGFKGGYLEEGIKTIVPNIASAKLSIRLVANQKATEIQNQLIKYFEKHIHKSVKFKINLLPNAEPYYIDTKNTYLQIVKKALKAVYSREVFELKSGGSLPIVSTFEKELNCKSILIGFGLQSDNAHGVDEHFGLSNLFKGIKTITEFYQLLYRN